MKRDFVRAYLYIEDEDIGDQIVSIPVNFAKTINKGDIFFVPKADPELYPYFLNIDKSLLKGMAGNMWIVKKKIYECKSIEVTIYRDRDYKRQDCRISQNPDNCNKFLPAANCKKCYHKKSYFERD